MARHHKFRTDQLVVLSKVELFLKKVILGDLIDEGLQLGFPLDNLIMHNLILVVGSFFRKEELLAPIVFGVAATAVLMVYCEHHVAMTG